MNASIRAQFCHREELLLFMHLGHFLSLLYSTFSDSFTMRLNAVQHLSWGDYVFIEPSFLTIWSWW
jgi:hypothetical protein